MKRVIFVAVFAAVLAMAGCTGNETIEATGPEGVVSVVNDLESNYWINLNTLTVEQAHSGKTSSKVDGNQEFSFGYNSIFRNISDTVPVVIEVRAWLFCPEVPTNANLVISIDSLGGKNLFWQGVPLQDSLPAANTWTEVKCRFSVPGNITPDNSLKIYFWGIDKKTFYVDDMMLNFFLK